MWRKIATAALALAMGCGGVAIAAEDLGLEHLRGLWEASRYFPASVAGSLLLRPEDGHLVADIGGYRVPVTDNGARLSFSLPGGRGSFRGQRSAAGREIRGFWLQPPIPGSGRAYMSNVTLQAGKNGSWMGQIRPLADSATFFLPITVAPDGTASTYLREPEANQGILYNVGRLSRNGSEIDLLGVRRGQTTEAILFKGYYHDGELTFPGFQDQLSYDFSRVEDESISEFYPRGNAPIPYHYAEPVARDDGWAVATLSQVGISQRAIEKFIQKLIDVPMESIHTPQIHAVLIARHDKLVLEEYFHGYDRDRPHDTRSAAKSWTATLIGAAIQSGVPIKLSTPVYATMLGREPPDLDPRKKSMTLEHLLSMTAGFDCDENSDAPGSEDVMQDQTAQPDWYKYTMDVALVTAPGEKIQYCSAEPNLAAGVLEKVAGEPLPEMFDRLVARPLQMGTYYLLMTPTETAYGGGGHRFLPRDFMKLAQLMLNGGTWNGRRIVSQDWARIAGLPMHTLNNEPPLGQQYGYLWNSKEYPYKNRAVRGYFAAGNGGQIFMAIPDLDLVIAFWGGSYADGGATRFAQRYLIPQDILPAVD
jgi:CubicO group peptidase (beta-lactamase class C family)